MASYIGADPRTCRGFSRGCTLRDQMVRIARFSCGFFTVMAGNKAGKKSQGSSMYFNALS